MTTMALPLSASPGAVSDLVGYGLDRNEAHRVIDVITRRGLRWWGIILLLRNHCGITGGDASAFGLRHYPEYPVPKPRGWR